MTNILPISSECSIFWVGVWEGGGVAFTGDWARGPVEVRPSGGGRPILRSNGVDPWLRMVLSNDRLQFATISSPRNEPNVSTFCRGAWDAGGAGAGNSRGPLESDKSAAPDKNTKTSISLLQHYIAALPKAGASSISMWFLHHIKSIQVHIISK